MKKIVACFAVLVLNIFSQESFAENMVVPRLKLLQSKGFNPKVVYDIGAWHGEWSDVIKHVFSQSDFILFEANSRYEPFLKLQEFPYFIGILGNEEKNVVFYTNDSTGDSVFREQTMQYEQGCCAEKQMTMTTLTAVVKKHNLPLPDLIKMDVQGAEALIIQGGLEVVSHAEVIILETQILEYNQGAPLIYEVMSLMDRLGYLCLDVVETHYLPTGELNELDILFVKKESQLIKRGLLVQ